MANRTSGKSEQTKKRVDPSAAMGDDALIFHELFNVLVFQFRVVSVEYFMDTMTEWEINDIIENLPFLDRNMWEACRLKAWITIQANSTDDVAMQDVLKFKWDEESVESKEIEISNEDIARLREKAKQISNAKL